MQSELLQLNREILHRRANGKTIWQPRINCWYDDRIYRGENLPGKYKGCNRTELYEKIGCSSRLYEFNDCLEEKLDDSVKSCCERIGELTWKHTMETPVGTVTQVLCGNTDNAGTMPKKWWVENEQDLKVFAYIEQATTFSFNMDTYRRLLEELAHLGLPTIFIPRVNIQKMFVNLAGVPDSIYLLTDSEDTVEAYFRALSESQEKMLKIVADSPIEWINYGDNLHCKILPPSLYKKYVLPEYEKRGDILHKAGKFTYSHWDGDVKDFLPFAKSSFLDGIEAITPTPQGDVTVEEVKKALGDDIFLVDGIASLLFSKTYPIEALKEQVEKAMNLFEGQLVLGISDEFPSDGLIERVEYVNDLVNEFNSKR